METELLSVDDITDICRIRKVTAQRWCHKWKLPAAGIGGSRRYGKNGLDSRYRGKLLVYTMIGH